MHELCPKLIVGSIKIVFTMNRGSLIKMLMGPDYLVPLSRYLTSEFLVIDFDFRPLEVIWGQKYFLIHDFLSNFY